MKPGTVGEFGHFSSRSRDCFVDAWGAGPFILEVAGKRHRFEDSDRFGPSKVNANGDIAANPWWGERHPFWAAHRLWNAQGRRLAADGITCVWSAGRPTIVRMIDKRNAIVVSHGDIDGDVFDMDTPEGQAAIQQYGIVISPPRSATSIPGARR